MALEFSFDRVELTWKLNAHQICISLCITWIAQFDDVSQILRKTMVSATLKLNFSTIHKYILTYRSHLIDACANRRTIFSRNMRNGWVQTKRRGNCRNAPHNTTQRCQCQCECIVSVLYFTGATSSSSQLAFAFAFAHEPCIFYININILGDFLQHRYPKWSTSANKHLAFNMCRHRALSSFMYRLMCIV